MEIYRTEGMPSFEERLVEARALVLKEQRASISTLQRYLRIGYNVSARLLEELEREGLVSPMDTMGRRTVLKAP